MNNKNQNIANNRIMDPGGFSGFMREQAPYGMRTNRFAAAGFINRTETEFCFRVTAYESGQGLGGAVFSLTEPGGSSAQAVSDASGLVKFTVKPGTYYILREISPSPGYEPHESEYIICVDCRNRLTVNNRPVRAFTVSSRIQPPANGLIARRLQAAQAQAARPQAMHAVNTQAAQAQAVRAQTARPQIPRPQIPRPQLSPAQLAPAQLTPAQLAQMRPITTQPVYPFSFTKFASGCYDGLPGATFRLSLNGAAVGTAISDVNGTVNFGMLRPGRYQLTEIAPPSGYIPDRRIYTVEVRSDGVVTVDGVPSKNFSPSNIPVAVNAKTLTGRVFPVAYDDRGHGASFLRMFDTVAELRKTFRTPAPPNMRAIAVPVGTGGFGQFTIRGVAPGDYLLYLNRPGYLARAMKITVSESDPETVNLTPPDGEAAFELWPGDADGNNAVDSHDVETVSARQGQNAFDLTSGYASSADFNADGYINAEDLRTVSENVGKGVHSYPGMSCIDTYR